MASYPTSVKTFSTPSSTTQMDDSGFEGDTVISDIHDEVEAIETELGAAPKTITQATTPAASPASVAEFLDMVATHLKNIHGGANWYTAVGTSLATDVAALATHIADTTTHGTTGNVVGETDTQTLTNKTLTSPVLNGNLTGSGVVDEDTMSSDSATKVPTQQSVKAYVDSSSSIISTTKFAPQGFLINGKISVSVATNDITVAIKGMDGNDPSASNKVYVRIGDTVRTITSALSVTKNDGTNWFNSGSSELATIEQDYFVYLGYNATDGVVIGFARIPSATSYGDFSATTTNARYCAISNITTAASTDYYELIGRFAATLSATASFNWSVPTFTAANLIQRPIYETRWLTWNPTVTGFSVNPTQTNYRFKLLQNDTVDITVRQNSVGTSNGTGLTLTAPILSKTISNMFWQVPCFSIDNGTNQIGSDCYIGSNSSTFTLEKLITSANYTASGNKLCYFNISYEY